MKNSAYIRRLLRSTVLSGAAIAAAAPAFAQDDEGDDDTIVVTGSRIPQANLTTSSPVTQVNADEFLYRGVTRVEDLINDLPQVLASNTSGDSNGATGTATIDLRGLGIERTLVLVNGRRLPIGSPQSGASAPDINFIPGSLVERVEVLTGGASATYGSDAIGGVVNFMLQDDFEGFRVDYQYGVYQHNNNNSDIQSVVTGAGFDVPTGGTWGGGIHDISATIGANTGDGRGNVTGYFTYRNVKAVLQGERDYSACALTGSADSFGCGGSSTTPLGRFTDFGTAAVNFDTELNLDTGALDPFGTLYNYNPLNFYQRPDERITGGFFGRYEINSHAEVYASFMFMDNRSGAQIAPTGTFFFLSTIPCSNVLFTAEQFNTFCGQQGLTTDDNAQLFIGRRNVEGGGRLTDLRHTQWRSVLGVRGAINDTWTYDLFAMYGEVAHSQVNRNDFFGSRLANALDVVDDGSGNAVCQSVVDGTDPACVPYDIFNPGQVTQAALSYLQVPTFATGGTEQTTVSGYIAGDLGDWGMQFPGASPIQTVLGFEYREEFLDFEPDFVLGNGLSTGLGGPTLPASGRLDVYEFFTELRVPIIEGREFFEELSFDGAYRFSTYSTDVDTHTYKLAASWAPSTDVKFRGSYQRAVRHPNVRELFRPTGIGLFDVDETDLNGDDVTHFDPCAGAVPERSLADCMNTGVTAAQYGFIADSPAGQFNEITGGNPNLEPEESDTFSAGVILTPGFVPGFSLTVDWFSIDVQKAIDEVPSATILQQCLDTGVAEFCNAINRGVTGNGTLWIGQDNIRSLDVNLGFFKTTGIDFIGGYSVDTGYGDLNFNWVATWLMSWEQQAFPGAPVEACEGIFNSSCGAPRPEFTSNFRTTWGSPWGADLTVNWRYLSSVSGAEEFDSFNYIDFAAIYPVNENVTLRAGVNNVFDVEPPLTSSAGPSIFGNGNTFPGVYDALGRFVFAGATVTF